jgi:hypothetical protein
MVPKLSDMKKALKLSKISTPTPKQDESMRPIERIVEGLPEKNRNFESVGEVNQSRPSVWHAAGSQPGSQT